MHRIALFGLALQLMLPGCSAVIPFKAVTNGTSVPSDRAAALLADGNKSTTPVSTAGTLSNTALEQPTPVAADQSVIVGFKRSTVILYGSPDSHEGERVPTDALSVPLKPSSQTTNASRVQIMTIDGPRWIAKSDVTFGPAS